jgi:hypothetical protein
MQFNWVIAFLNILQRKLLYLEVHNFKSLRQYIISEISFKVRINIQMCARLYSQKEISLSNTKLNDNSNCRNTKRRRGNNFF